MPKLPAPILFAALVASLVGGVAFTDTSYADTTDTSHAAMESKPPLPLKHQNVKITSHNKMLREQPIEQRIQTLHDKLAITSEQESKWRDVAETMRNNEITTHNLMQQRYENRKTMTAVDDLQSYKAIAEAHIDGLNKLIPVFQALYTDMSDDQKKDADEAFGRFEGHRDGKSGKKHG